MSTKATRGSSHNKSSLSEEGHNYNEGTSSGQQSSRKPNGSRSHTSKSLQQPSHVRDTRSKRKTEHNEKLSDSKSEAKKSSTSSGKYHTTSNSSYAHHHHFTASESLKTYFDDSTHTNPGYNSTETDRQIWKYGFPSDPIEISEIEAAMNIEARNRGEASVQGYEYHFSGQGQKDY